MAYRHRGGWLAALFVALLVAWPAGAQAQDAAGTVWTQLEAAYGWASEQGYATRNYIIGKLQEDEDDTWTMTLYGGNEYLIVGTCDADCADLDIQILDENDEVVAKDTETDDVPVVELDLEENGRYQIKVTMYSCSVEPCYFGLGLFYN